MLFSLFQTNNLWNINQRQWLSQYLLACAQNGGSPPANAKSFLPWNMTADRLQELQITKSIDSS
jgi:transposase